MRKLLILLVPFMLLAQQVPPKQPEWMGKVKREPYEKPASVITPEMAGYCGTSDANHPTIIPKGQGRFGRVHVRFHYNCSSRNPAGLSHKMGWMWILIIYDDTDKNEAVKTEHETAWGMDIIGVRGHKIFYDVSTR